MEKEKFNQKKYIQKYNSEHYRQLKVDLPSDIFEMLDKKLKEDNLTKRQFILNCIEDYLTSKKQ